MELATLKYEVTSDAPRNLLRQITGDIAPMTGSEAGFAREGRAYLRRSNNVSTETYSECLSSYRRVSKSFRKGEKIEKQIKFPLRMGKVSYIDTIAAANQLSILFRHDSCMANNYADEYEDDDFGDATRTGEMELNGKHHQPQVYFVIQINTETGAHSYRIVNSPLAIRGRMFPHNSSNTSNVYSSNCAGGYADQMKEALRQENLGLFLSVFSDYLINGTRVNDEYGRSYEYFGITGYPRDLHIRVENVVEAKVLGHVWSDPETPFEYDLSTQARTLTFVNPACESIFHATLCKGLS